MTTEETIQALYADIAAIKAFICDPKPVIARAYISGVHINRGQHSTIPIPSNAGVIQILGLSDKYLSRIFDRESPVYDQYLYEGMGSVFQINLSSTGYGHGYPFIKIDKQCQAFEKMEGAEYLHLRPVPSVEMYAFFWTA